jgi:hypothetical protein
MKYENDRLKLALAQRFVPNDRLKLALAQRFVPNDEFLLSLRFTVEPSCDP